MPAVLLHEHDALPPGTRLGEFEIECVLGVGGFGIVYRALDHDLERRVAIKEYMPAALVSRVADGRLSVRSAQQVGTFELGLRSFINEARLLARFDHPSLVKVYRFWEANDTAYMAMPWYEGVTLREARRLMSGPPDEAWLRGLLDPLLGALESLHREQVFHRDVAPDNILLLKTPPDGEPGEAGLVRPVLLDFGAARLVVAGQSQSPTAILKPSFAPIEQYAEAGSLRQGPWTDIYALGAVVHFCVTGRAPIPATTRAVDDQLVSLAALAPALERDFDRAYSPAFLAAIDRALAVKPQDRPVSIAVWRRELEATQPCSPHGEAAPDGMTRTVVATAADRPAARDAANEATAYATTAPAAAPASALGAAARTWSAAGSPAGAAPAQETWARTLFQPTRPEATGRSAAAAAAAAASNRAPGVRIPHWMSAVLVLMLLVTAWALWQARQARHARSSLRATESASVALADTGTAARPAASVPAAGMAVGAAPSTPAGRRAAARAERASAEAREARPAASSGRRASRTEPRTEPRTDERPDERPDERSAEASGTPRSQCGGRVFIALAICMKRVCNRPEYYPHPQCVRFREMEAANRPQR